MRDRIRTLLAAGVLCGAFMAGSPFTAMAAIGPGFTAGTYAASITSETVNINKSLDTEEVLLTAEAGNAYEVLEDMGGRWLKDSIRKPPLAKEADKPAKSLSLSALTG